MGWLMCAVDEDDNDDEDDDDNDDNRGEEGAQSVTGPTQRRRARFHDNTYVCSLFAPRFF